MDKTKRFSDWAPPRHRPDRFTIEAAELDDDWRLTVTAYAPTHQGRLYTIDLHVGVEPRQTYANLIVAQTAQVLIEDFLRDRPNTEARAYFVAGGGLYEQLGFDNLD